MTFRHPVPAEAVVSIPDIRDYERINAELVQRLDSGHTRVRLVGAEGQRFLAARLAGGWSAVVEVEGRAGPELAAEMDAPSLTVVCGGHAADGAARGLVSGRVIILGDADEALGYAQRGGVVLVAGGAGARAGLNQQGGTLAILGKVGRLAGERQRGGRLLVDREQLGPHAGRGARGGRMVRLPVGAGEEPDCAPGEIETLRAWLAEFGPSMPPDIADVQASGEP